MRYAFFLSLTLAALWLAVSGVYKPLLFGFGLCSIGFVVWLSLRMEVVGVEHHPGLYFPRLLPYWGWLVRQIIVANIHVAKRVFQPKGLSPQIIEVPVHQHTAVSRVTYANSCTLTPGTLTLEVTPKSMTVHALDDVSAKDLQTGAMGSKVLWLEGMPAQENTEPSA
jgi:multicomponent Na+:H+ antiporter subunit E